MPVCNMVYHWSAARLSAQDPLLVVCWLLCRVEVLYLFYQNCCSTRSIAGCLLALPSRSVYNRDTRSTRTALQTATIVLGLVQFLTRPYCVQATTNQATTNGAHPTAQNPTTQNPIAQNPTTATGRRGTRGRAAAAATPPMSRGGSSALGSSALGSSALTEPAAAGSAASTGGAANGDRSRGASESAGGGARAPLPPGTPLVDKPLYAIGLSPTKICAESVQISKICNICNICNISGPVYILGANGDRSRGASGVAPWGARCFLQRSIALQRITLGGSWSDQSGQ